jgi:DNA polymerase III sliding clamp (beta) subunit (PCNA family)
MKIIAGGEVEFEAIGKDIAAAFAKITAVTTYVKADDTKFVIAAVSSEEGKENAGIFLIGFSTDAMASMRISGKAKKSGTIRVDAVTLAGLLKARGECEFKSGTGKIIFREKKSEFKASLDIMEFDDEDIRMLSLQFGEIQGVPIAKDVMDKLLDSVRKVALLDVYHGHILPVIFDIGEKWLKVYCFDDFHVALFKQKIKNKVPMRMALPTKVFSMVEKFIEDDDVKFSTGLGRFVASSKDFIVSIPETQLRDGDYTMALHYIKTLQELDPRASITFDTKATATVANMAVLTDQDTKMAITIDKEKTTLSVKGKGGVVSDSFKAKATGKPLDMRVDPRIFMDLFNKVKADEVTMVMYKIPAAMSTFMLTNKLDNGTLTLVGTYDEAK